MPYVLVATYDSEDTIDEDSASDIENYLPEVPVKLPTSPSPVRVSQFFSIPRTDSLLEFLVF